MLATLERAEETKAAPGGIDLWLDFYSPDEGKRVRCLGAVSFLYYALSPSTECIQIGTPRDIQVGRCALIAVGPLCDDEKHLTARYILTRSAVEWRYSHEQKRALSAKLENNPDHFTKMGDASGVLLDARLALGLKPSVLAGELSEKSVT